MNQHNVHLLDLPNEILFLILKNLDNTDVLYSLFGINNQRLNIIVQEPIFTNILNFVSISQSTDEIFSISNSILSRFSIDILPRIHKNVQSLILQSDSMECILRAGIYPNLTQLKIFNFNKSIFSHYFMDDSLFQHIDKQQLTDLILIINENNTEITQKEYTKNVYANILAFFKNLKHLSIASSSVEDYPLSSLCYLPSMTFSSSTLTKLSINVNDFDDCLSLLDGRLKQLTEFIVQVDYISNWTSTFYSMDDLPNLKCFSLTCYRNTEGYDILVVPLLRRMSHLEELTLYILIFRGSTCISGTHLDNEILIHMPRLHTFTFYIVSQNVDADPTVHVSVDDIQRTFTNIKYREVACMVDYFNSRDITSRVFSLPFKFDRLENITNNIPNIVFDSVTHLKLWDKDPFKHDFFVRLTRAFPFLKYLSMWNIQPPFFKLREFHLYEKDWCSIVEYPHLISLDFGDTAAHYLEHFLNETKTYLPRLTELKVDYDHLQNVTENFTNDEMRHNCSRIKRLIVEYSIVFSKDVYDYFPLLSI
ncbi:unnamed protein product [Rotaria sordida]|uniref:F-box domain-containing protein n=1 Tax=Rotaria sordida TaxID=392033 RepID=A0A814NT37_9BILA|nr:unnamed protein product [Rotaria sordida]